MCSWNTDAPATTKSTIGYFWNKGHCQSHNVFDLGVIWTTFIRGVCLPNMKNLLLRMPFHITRTKCFCRAASEKENKLYETYHFRDMNPIIHAFRWRKNPIIWNPIQYHDTLKNSLLSIEWTLNAFSNYIYIIGTMYFTKEVCKFTTKRKDGVYNVTHREPYQHWRFSCSECLRKQESFEQNLR